MATVYCTAINANQITLTMPNMMSLAIVIQPANWGVAEDNWPPSLIRKRMEGFANPDKIAAWRILPLVDFWINPSMRNNKVAKFCIEGQALQPGL